MNTQDQDTVTHSPNGIHFPIKFGGQLISDGSTGWSGLSVLFAVDQTASLGDWNGETHYLYQTDRAGLVTTINLGHQAADAICDALEVIGRICAYADHRELGETDRQSISWLTCGLGELLRQVNSATYSCGMALADGRHLDATKCGDRWGMVRSNR